MSYDRLARPYALIERFAFASQLQEARTRLIPRLPKLRRALLVGEGDGRFLEALLAARPSLRITVVDASAGMIERAAARVGPTDRVEYLCTDVRQAQLPRHAFDLAVTHFFFDGFARTAQIEIAARLAEALTSRASWLVAEFCPPTAGFAGLRAHAWLTAMYAFFAAATEIEARRLDAHGPALLEQGFEPLVSEPACRRLARTELWSRNLTNVLC